jgi:nucleotide-binding universal stress UspA family protein
MGPRYERILVALDGSETAEAILPFAEEVAGPHGAEIVLVRVAEPLSPGEARAAAGVAAPDASFVRELEARQYLARAAERLVGRGLRVRTDVRMGAAAAQILAAAAEVRADLIAMSTHGRGGVGRLLFGSVAEAVLRGARVPVLLIRAVSP